MHNLQYFVPFSPQGPCFKSNYQECSVKKGVLRNFAKFTGKRLCQSLVFNKVAGACSFIKEETLVQVFSCKFCEIGKNTFFTEHIQATAFWCLGACLSANKGNHLSIGCNSKNVRAATKTFQCRGRPNLSEGACQKSCESNRNWGS